ncbi:hypothetical protein IWZ01DRAFT_180291 [Phyllosticta capitalensis]
MQDSHELDPLCPQEREHSAPCKDEPEQVPPKNVNGADPRLFSDGSGGRRFARIEDLATWIPDTTNPAKWTTQRAMMLCIHVGLSTAVLLLNIGFAASSIYNFDMETYTGQYFAGSCSSVKVANRWIHLAINVLSSLLLLSSNYCMQILVAPTREEVDEKHKNKDWFDIGVQSWRNWKRIALRRRIVCVILMVSSALLHLMWNSAVFSATPVSWYRVAMVTSDFESDPNPWTNNSWTGDMTPNIQQMRNNISGLDRLNKTECFDRYISGSVGMGDLIVVSSNVTMADNQSIIYENTSASLLDMTSTARGSNWIMYNFWMCNRWKQTDTYLPTDWCTRDFLEPRLNEWTWKGWRWTTPNPSKGKYLYSRYYKIDYCLSDGDNSKVLEEKCALQFSSIVLIVVCVLNATKCVCILYTAHIQWQSTVTSTSENNKKTQKPKKMTRILRRLVPKRLRNWYDEFSQMKKDVRENAKKVSLVTVGDAIASFLEHKDPWTCDKEMASMEDFTSQWPEKDHYSHYRIPEETIWFKSASRSKWYLTYGLISIMAIIAAPLLVLELYNLWQAGIPIDPASLWSEGIGSFNPYAYVVPQVVEKLPQLGQYFFSTFVANIFQVIISFFYLVYNSLITSLLIADEWNRFIYTRKAVRVSTPRSLQRSSYFLSLPLKYSVPLNIINTLLHWLVSQCVFVVASVEMITPDFSHDKENDSFIIGFSTIATVLAIPAGAILFLTPLPLAYYWRLKAPASVEEEDEGATQCVGHSDADEGKNDGTTPGPRTSVISTASSSPDISRPVSHTKTDSKAQLLPLETTTQSPGVGRPSKHAKSTYPMPLASTCSAAISAACHSHEEDVHAHLLPITWGFVGNSENSEEGRFCFTTARDVRWPSKDDLSRMKGRQLSDGGGV